MAESRAKSISGLRFVLTAALLSVAVFGFLNLPLIESAILIPLTRSQHTLACRIGGDPNAPISVGLSCSAADVMALCLGFVLALPVSWRRRLAGAGLGLALILTLNIVRIATLTRAIGNAQWFNALHVYLWPAILILAVSLFVFLWMRRCLATIPISDSVDHSPPGRETLLFGRPARFVLMTTIFVALFIGASSWWMHSGAILAIAHVVAETGAFIIRLGGGQAEVSGNILRTTSGGWVVTQECVMTPLIPVYFAAIFSFALAREQRILAMLTALPVFFVLGTARLLILAIPTQIVGSHFIAIHGFYQMLVAAILIGVTAWWSERVPRAPKVVWQRAMTALVISSLVALIWSVTFNRMLIAGVAGVHRLLDHSGHDYLDPQGALAIMGPYQLGLLLGLWLASNRRASVRRLLVSGVFLLMQQAVVLFVVGEWVAHTGLPPHVAATRAFTIFMVLATIAWMLKSTAPDSSVDEPSETAGGLEPAALPSGSNPALSDSQFSRQTSPRTLGPY